MKRFLFHLPPYTFTVIIAVVILYLTLDPDPLPDNDFELFPGADKLVHAIMFAALAGAIALDRWRRGIVGAVSFKALAVYALIASVAGGLVEVLQGSMGVGRSADVWDFVADALGAIIGVLVARWWFRHPLISI